MLFRSPLYPSSSLLLSTPALSPPLYPCPLSSSLLSPPLSSSLPLHSLLLSTPAPPLPFSLSPSPPSLSGDDGYEQISSDEDDLDNSFKLPSFDMDYTPEDLASVPPVQYDPYERELRPLLFFTPPYKTRFDTQLEKARGGVAPGGVAPGGAVPGDV